VIVRSSTKPSTRVYVRTNPEGANVKVDGKPVGQASRLITVPAGVKRMRIEVSFDQRTSKEHVVEIEQGRIHRVEFEFTGDVIPSEEFSISFLPVTPGAENAEDKQQPNRLEEAVTEAETQ
jgi:hypothetical protein